MMESRYRPGAHNFGAFDSVASTSLFCKWNIDQAGEGLVLKSPFANFTSKFLSEPSSLKIKDKTLLFIERLETVMVLSEEKVLLPPKIENRHLKASNEPALSIQSVLVGSRHRSRDRQYAGLRQRQGHRCQRAIHRRHQQDTMARSKPSAKKPKKCWGARPATSSPSGR